MRKKKAKYENTQFKVNEGEEEKAVGKKVNQRKGIQHRSTIDSVFEKIGEICLKMKNIPTIGDFFWSAYRMSWMIRDYVSGEYREVPCSSIITATLALVYVVCPIELIPDFVPALGLIDDAAAVLFALKAVEGDLNDYWQWKVEQFNVYE